MKQNISRLLSALLILCMVLMFLPVTALAAEPASGTCGSSVTWSLDANGTLIISGTGAMYDYQTGYKNIPYTTFYSTAPWWNYRLQIKKVVVENGVTYVGDCAFCGDNAFAGELFYENLTEVTLANSVTSIGEDAFSTGYLQTVQLGTGLQMIGSGAFFGNQRIREISFPDTLTTIGSRAFELTGLTRITVPYSVTSIGERAFGYNYVAEGAPVVSMNFTIEGYAGTSAESYYKQLLQNYNNEKTLLGQGQYYSDNYAPDGTIHFIPIPYNGTNPGTASNDFVIESDVLIAYNGSGGDVIIPNGVTGIGEEAFAGCSSLTSVTIPNSITAIGANAFLNCPSLTNVTIPNSVTTIGYAAFLNCISLTNVTIPDSVTTISGNVFGFCDNLTSINVTSGNAAYSSADGVLFSSDKTVLHTYPAGKGGHYSIPSSVTAIKSDAFCGSLKLTSVTIPNSVTTIGLDAFGFCSNLADVYYGGSESQWKQMFYDVFNYSVPTIHYNSTEPTSSTSSDISVTVGGKAVVWTDAAPFIDVNSRTMVPLRAVGDALGLTVDWDSVAREAIFTDGIKTIYFPIDNTTARTSDGRIVQMDTAAVIVNDRTYAPIRYLAEFFGFTVGWDNETRTVIIE